MMGHVMIIGPTGSGKTKIAYEWARRHKGELVNLDRAYLYRHFRIATGLQDAIKETGVNRHLYELLEPVEPSLSSLHFLELVESTVKRLENSKKLVVAEGGSTQYVPALLEDSRYSGLFKHIIGVRCPLTNEYIEKYILRIEQAFEEGLAAEIERNLDLYHQSYLIKECHGAVPTVKYLTGELTLQQAKNEILERSLAYRSRQMSIFEQFSNVKWIDGNDTMESISAIEEICSTK